SPKPDDVLANYKEKEWLNDFYLDVFVKGEYPANVRSYLDAKNIIPVFEQGDKELLKHHTVDYLSISYYQSQLVQVSESGVEMINDPQLPVTEWGASIDPIGLRIALKDMHSRYHMPIFITENGMGVRERLNEHYTVEDHYRIQFLKSHIK